MDTCSPTGVLEDFFRTEEFETSCSSKPSKSDSANEGSSKQSSRWREFAQLFGYKWKKPSPIFRPLGSFRLSLRRSSSMRDNVTVSPDFLANNTNSYNLKSPGKVFTLSELQIATKNFSSGQLLCLAVRIWFLHLMLLNLVCCFFFGQKILLERGVMLKFTKGVYKTGSWLPLNV